MQQDMIYNQIFILCKGKTKIWNHKILSKQMIVLSTSMAYLTNFKWSDKMGIISD